MEIVNRVANSKLQTIDLQEFYPNEGFEIIDLKDVLYEGMILREKEFREWVKDYHWGSFEGKNVLIQCSVDAIIPQWAYMIISSKLEGICKYIGMGSEEKNRELYMHEQIRNIDFETFRDKPVVIKGCFDKPVDTSNYMLIASLLKPYCKSIMYGEPCSTVPVYKAPKKQ